MTQPFEKVQHLHFDMDFSDDDTAALSMNQLFPALRNLSLNLYSHNKYINCHFAQLERLKANPQIRSLIVKSHWPIAERLTFLSKIMTNLENLTICGSSESFFISDNPIHFKTVTKFVMNCRDYWPNEPRKLSFPHLKELDVALTQDNCEKWVEFLHLHPNIERIYIAIRHMTLDIVERLTTSLPNVVELTASIDKMQEGNLNAMVAFGDTNVRILKMELLLASPDDSIRKMATNQDRWQTSDNRLVFVRESWNSDFLHTCCNNETMNATTKNQNVSIKPDIFQQLLCVALFLLNWSTSASRIVSLINNMRTSDEQYLDRKSSIRNPPLNQLNR